MDSHSIRVTHNLMRPVDGLLQARRATNAQAADTAVRTGMHGIRLQIGVEVSRCLLHVCQAVGFQVHRPFAQNVALLGLELADLDNNGVFAQTQALKHVNGPNRVVRPVADILSLRTLPTTGQAQPARPVEDKLTDG